MNDRLRRSRKQEQDTARRHGGRVQPGSGNSWARKGDVRTKTTLIENKRTDCQQITIKAAALEKIWTEAWAEGRMPLLEFELDGRHWLIINRDDYLEGQEAPIVDARPPSVVESG